MMTKFYIDHANNNSVKMAFYYIKQDLFVIEYSNHFKGIFLDEIWLKRPVGILFTLNNFLFKLAEDVLQHTISTGIPQWRRKYLDEFIFKIEPIIEDDKPKVLSLKDLGFGFNIVLVALGISCIVFLFECTYYLVKKFSLKQISQFIGNILVLLNVLQWLKRYR
jgi:hypothetical protein